VYVLEKLICRGIGTNKKKAQDDGARIAMELLEVVDGEVRIGK